MKRLKGLNRDSAPIDQPEGTYRDAKNAIFSKKFGAIASEGGTISQDSLPVDGGGDPFTLLGSTLIYDQHQILFLTDEDTDHRIGIFDGQTYTDLVADSSLNFDTAHPIEAVTIINNKSEVVVYWTDGQNPPRFYNIDRNDGFSDVNTLNIFPTISSAPLVQLDSVNSGGVLKSGAYHFGIALYTEDNSRTNYMSVTPPIYITDDSDPVNHDSYDGVDAGTKTSKSIRLKINNLDTTYSKFEIVMLRKENGTIAEVSKLQKQQLSSDQVVINITGNEGTIASSLDEFLINTAVYQNAETITEQDNTLYMGNLSKKPDIGYQKYANNIKVESVVEDLSDGGNGLTDKDHYGNPVLSFYDKSFKRGEVYAFYISFVLENGQDSQAYHIPGRGMDSGEDNDLQGFSRFQVVGDKNTNNMAFWENQDEKYPSGANDPDGNFEVWDVDGSGVGHKIGSIQGDNVRHHHFPDNNQTGMKFWTGENNSKYAKKLGIKLTDIKIPKDIIDRIRGVKILYAKRDESNQRVIDQGLVYPMRKAPHSPAGKDDIAWCYYRHRGDGSASSEGVIFEGFNSLRTKKNIGSATFLREVGQPTGDSKSDGDGDPEQIFFDSVKEMYDANDLIPIKAITYMDGESYVSGISKNFSYNIDNTKGESGIAIEFKDNSSMMWDGGGEAYPTRNINTSGDRNSDAYAGRICELVQVLSNMYAPFDQQELVWTGLQENNIDLFDPRTTGGTSGASASGSINVTGGVDTLAPTPQSQITIPNDGQETGAYASGYIDVTANNLAASSSENHNITVGANQTGAIQIDDTDTLEGIVDKYVSEINGDANISPDWTASKVDNGDGTWRCLITANNFGTSYNGTTVSVQNNTDVDVSVSDASGGVDQQAYSGTITIDFSLPYDTISVNYQVPNAETKDNVASNLNAAIRNKLPITIGYNITLDTSGADPVITIEAKSNGAYYNGTLSITEDAGTGINKDSDFNNGTDSGLLQRRQSIGWIDVSYIISDGDMIATIPAPPFRPTFEDVVSFTVAPTDSPSDVASSIYAALDASNTYDEYDFYYYGTKVYFSYPDTTSYDGANIEVDQDPSKSNSGSIAITQASLDGRPPDDYSSIDIVISTPKLNKGINVVTNTGDSAATVESNILAALQADTDFNQHYTATGNDPINITANATGSAYNGGLSINEGQSGIVAVISGLSGGSDGSASDLTIESVYGGDTFISLFGTRRTMWSYYGDGAELWQHLSYVPVESLDNIKLRQSGEDYGQGYYPKSPYKDMLLYEKDAKDPFKDIVFDNYIKYNPDYSTSATIKTATPVSKNSNIVYDYPTRVIRSAQGDSTTGDTGIRTFLENDYMDLTKSRGPLNKLVIMQNILMAHMERSLIRTKGREELTTGDFRAYLGAGDIFSAKPDELMSTKEGFAGLQDKLCSIVTPAGYFFVDRQARQVFLVNQKPEIISEHGLETFFNDELKDANPDELIATYDNRHDRIILTYKNNWTLSYYPALKMWTSFHDYNPDYYLSDLEKFYSIKNGDIWSHNEDTKTGEFYNTIETTEFEFIENRKPQLTKKFVSLQFITDVVDQSGNYIHNETFDKFRVSNNFQDSGLQDVIYFTGANGNARNVEGTWKLNNFRNMLVNGVVDTNKPWQDQDRFVSKWLRIRLVFNNSSNKSLYLYDAEAGMKPSYR